MRSRIRPVGRSSVRYAFVALVMTLVAIACGGDAVETTSTGTANVEFGSGEIPDTVPEDFPVMDGSVISSTLVNRDNGFTEMIVRMPVQLGVAVQYYNQEFGTAGYDVATSEATSDTSWEIAGSGSGVSMDLRLRTVQPEVTEAAVRIEPQS